MDTNQTRHYSGEYRYLFSFLIHKQEKDIKKKGKLTSMASQVCSGCCWLWYVLMCWKLMNYMPLNSNRVIHNGGLVSSAQFHLHNILVDYCLKGAICCNKMIELQEWLIQPDTAWQCSLQRLIAPYNNLIRPSDIASPDQGNLVFPT